MKREGKSIGNSFFKDSVNIGDSLFRMRKPGGSNITSIGKSIFKGAVYIEVLAFLGCYAFYRKTNRDPEFRYRLYSSSSGYSHAILQTYYQIGETFNSELKIKEQDLKLWQEQGKRI